MQIGTRHEFYQIQVLWIDGIDLRQFTALLEFHVLLNWQKMLSRHLCYKTMFKEYLEQHR